MVSVVGLNIDLGNSVLSEVYLQKVYATEVIKSKSPTADILARKTSEIYIIRLIFLSTESSDFVSLLFCCNDKYRKKREFVSI